MAHATLVILLGWALLLSACLRYLAANTAFHFDADDTATGGFFWDGRVDSRPVQAGIPLLGAREMANPDKAAVVAKIARASWTDDFKALYGADAPSDAIGPAYVSGAVSFPPGGDNERR